MTQRRIDGFFYGLFMDSRVLIRSQVEADNPRRAFVKGHRLRIGRRATLVPDPMARAYGMVFSLTHDHFETLYGAPGLDMYRPEAVLAHGLDGGTFPALCYNLIQPPAPTEANAAYAKDLRKALETLHFPDEYIRSVS